MPCALSLCLRVSFLPFLSLLPVMGMNLADWLDSPAPSCHLISGGSDGKNLPAVQETWVPSLGWEDPLEEGLAAHSSILAWRTHGQRSLAGRSPRGCQETEKTSLETGRKYLQMHI